ncbi:MAG TPA: ABC transporter permease [Gemmatimonadaceae bacterium]|nr:ABC transporter permease [Gemmatimonadaceae bacterium]
MRLPDSVRENVLLAADTLRVNKLRSGLTVLGVVIGVSTVMAMAAIVQGIREQIVHTIEVAGPTTFYVMKVFSQTPLNPDRLPKWVRIRPDLQEAEAERIQSLPEIKYAGIWVQVFGRIEYQGSRTQQITFFGADDHFTDIQGGGLSTGRWFTRAEMASGSPVVVLDENFARKVFGREEPLGKVVRLAGRPAMVIGLYQPPDNIFAPPGQEIGAIVPYRWADHNFTIDKTNFLFISVKPWPGVTVADAQGAVMVALRNMRHLRPEDPNTFDFITQDQILQIFNNLTSVFFIVMVALSSVALLVGGIGVMAIMMVSVTDRTREIGVRKALGATRTDILLQFLTEAATLTGIGGLVGIVVGLGAGRLVTTLMHIDASTPIALTLVAVALSVAIGLVFGIIPANRAARLDPVEALRYE